MDEKIIIKYIAVWGWQILATIFLVGSLILFAVPRSLISGVLFVSTFIIFSGCEIMMKKRKNEMYEDAEDE